MSLSRIFISVLFLSLLCNDVQAQGEKNPALPSLIPYRVKDKWGFCNQDKKLVIPAIYSSVTLFKGGYAVVYMIQPQVGERPLQGEQAIIDSTGKEISRWSYDEKHSIEITVTPGGRIHVWQNGRLLFVRNRSGATFQPTKFKLQWTFNDHYYVAKKGKYLGVIDSSGKIVIPFRYRHIGMMDETGYALARKKDSTVGFINLEQKELFSFKSKNHQIIFGFYDGHPAAICASPGFDHPWGYIDRTGAIIIPMIYKEALYFTEGLAAVGEKGKQGFINTRGDTVVPFRYTKLDPFENGRAIFTDGTESGCVDKQGNEVIRIKQQIMYYINDDLLIVLGKENNFASREFWQLVNGKGEPLALFPGKHGNIYYERNGLIRMEDYYMDTRGNKYYEE